jgi:hypothetical protein
VIGWPKKKAAPRPKTLVGQWLLAGLLDQDGLRDQLAKSLNRGQPGWNYDEPAVVESACQIASRKLFPNGADAEEIGAFVARLRSLVIARKPGATTAGREETEAVIHAALGDPDILLSRFHKAEVFHAQAAVIAGARSKLGLGDATITQMIIDGERTAFERGWHPPLAARSSCELTLPQ